MHSLTYQRSMLHLKHLKRAPPRIHVFSPARSPMLRQVTRRPGSARRHSAAPAARRPAPRRRHRPDRAQERAIRRPGSPAQPRASPGPARRLSAGAGPAGLGGTQGTQASVFPSPRSRPNRVPGREHGTRAVASEPGLQRGNTPACVPGEREHGEREHKEKKWRGTAGPPREPLRAPRRRGCGSRRTTPSRPASPR